MRARYSAGRRYVPLSATLIDGKSSPNESPTESSSLSKSTTTSAPSTGDPGGVVSTSSAGDSRVRNSARQAVGGSALIPSGQKCFESFTRSDRDTFSPKTSSAGRSGKPRSRSRGSVIWLDACDLGPATSGRRTIGRDSGWLPTLTASNNQGSPSMLKWPAYRRLNRLAGGRKIPVIFWEWLMGWPIGATDLRPLAMDRFQSWLRQHGICSGGE